MPASYLSAVLSLTMKTLTPTLSNAKPPPGAIIIKDPYEVYLHTTPEDRSSDCLTITKESSALHTILLLINHNQYIESVLDPSSQVIAMSEATCHALALIYDLRIRLHMQSANHEVDETLGLTRNVPILVGDITLYIQFHIVRNPAYDVLLGRPFNILVVCSLGQCTHKVNHFTNCPRGFLEVDLYLCLLPAPQLSLRSSS